MNTKIYEELRIVKFLYELFRTFKKTLTKLMIRFRLRLRLMLRLRLRLRLRMRISETLLLTQAL